VSSPQGQSPDQVGARAPIRFPPVERPRVSIVVTGWRSAPYLMECLRSLHDRVGAVPYEVILSLNEPSPLLVQTLEREVEGARVLAASVNRGFAEACNQGGAAARGDLLVLLNDDAIVRDNWLEALVDAADHHEEAGAVGSRILLENGGIQEEGAVIWADGSTTLIGYRGSAASSPDAGLRRVDYCSAASLLVKRATWEAVGGIDTGYFPAYFEDVDLCMKIQAGGQTILHEPGSTVVHRDGSSTTLMYRTFLAERNKRRFASRWAPALARYEPAEEGNPEAVARAAKLGEARPLPIPGPQPPADDPAVPVGNTEADYLRRQLDVLMAYAASLEDAQTSGGARSAELESGRAEAEKEIHRLHHEAAALQSRERELETREKELEGELAAVLARRRYAFIDRAYDIAASIPGFRRALRWVVARQRGGGVPGGTR
jgi:GT2 family glycosyltransferase